MKNSVLKIIAILTLIIYIVINALVLSSSYAAQRNVSYESSDVENYSGYAELINEMKAKHPNWNFTIFYTGLDWNQVIKNETSAYHGRNVVPSYKSSQWKCSTCTGSDGGSDWVCASEAAVSYYMDPRNWINDTYIFMFETLSFNSAVQTIEGVQKIIANIEYMQGSTITYTTTNGSTATLDKSYAQVIMDAAREANISPYHLAARLKQEQGSGSRPGATATGTYSGYTGYYNFMNIGATGKIDSVVIKNGLEYAKQKGWTTPEISIKEGAKMLASNYISDGQDTLYLQKFDVDNQDGALYWHQYMQNVSATVTEGASTRIAYQNLGLLDSAIDFRIPVYENMPENKCGEPGIENLVTQNVKIKGTTVRIRSGAGTSYDIVKTVDTGYDLLRIELATSTNDGFYWDKVVLEDGRKGFVARKYLVQSPDITNCNDIVITNTSVNLRNGPGTEGTSIVTTLVTGQLLTRIETGKYNLNGYIWDRVKLSDGRQGYIAQNYITLSTETGNTNSVSNAELVRVICNSGLKVREEPGTDSRVLTYVDKNDVLTRIQAGVSNANGYVWDKIVTPSGIEGYIARGDSREDYIEVIQSASTPTPTPTPTNIVNQENNKEIKIENENLVAEPFTTIEYIKEKYSDTQIMVKDSNGNEVTSGNVGTGYKITIGDKEYTIVKLGDASGDGKINSTDLLKLVKHLKKTSVLNNEYYSAGDVTLDGQINSADLLKIVKFLKKTTTINL